MKGGCLPRLLTGAVSFVVSMLAIGGLFSVVDGPAGKALGEWLFNLSFLGLGGYDLFFATLLSACIAGLSVLLFAPVTRSRLNRDNGDEPT